MRIGDPDPLVPFISVLGLFVLGLGDRRGYASKEFLDRLRELPREVEMVAFLRVVKILLESHREIGGLVVWILAVRCRLKIHQKQLDIGSFDHRFEAKFCILITYYI